MRIVPKSCATKILLIILIIGLFYIISGAFILKSFYDLLVSKDKIIGHYDAVVIESWITPQSALIKMADSLYRNGVVKNIYITYFKPDSNRFYSGGLIPKFIEQIINLYILELSKETSTFKKIPIIVKDPVTINLAIQVNESLKSENYKRIVVLSESYHSQRTRKSFQKAFENSGNEVITIPVEMGITRDNWWKFDSGLAMIFSETIKLIYYQLVVL